MEKEDYVTGAWKHLWKGECRMIQQGVRVGTKRTFLQKSRKFNLMQTALGVGREGGACDPQIGRFRAVIQNNSVTFPKTELSSLQ